MTKTIMKSGKRICESFLNRLLDMPVREPNGLFDYIVEKMSATSPWEF